MRLAAGAAASLAAVMSLTEPAEAATAPLSDPHIVAHFDRSAGQVAESIVLEPDGSADVGFIVSRQVAHVSRTGQVRVLATMPLPPDGGVHTPTGIPSVTGIERTDDGTIYFLYSAGDRTLTGLWRLRPGGSPERLSALPAASFLNGLTRDHRTGDFYISDSTLGVVWRIGPRGGAPVVWAGGPALAPNGFFGPNGIKVHRGAVWVSDFDRGTMLRIPITRSGAAGAAETEATGLTSVDDFQFTGRGDQILVALNVPSELALVTPGKPTRIVLTARDGLDNPTSVAVRHGTVYVNSGALTTGGDANLLVARFRPR